MGVLSSRVYNYTMTDFIKDTREWVRGIPTKAGVKVNEENALRFITVYSCVQVIAQTMGSLPCHVYRERPSGLGADKVSDHPAWGLLQLNPNEEMTAQSWIEAQTGHIASSGNCYSIITRNRRGQVIELYPVDWHLIKPDRDKDTRKLRYVLNDRGKDEYLPPQKVLHVLGLSFDGVSGYSPIGMAKECIGLGMAAAEFASLFYSQGLNISGVISHPQKLDPQGKAYENIRKSIEDRAAGMANAHRPMLLEEGMTWSRAPIPFADAQFIETRQLNRQEICGLYRVPPHMVADLQRSTNNNIEWQSLEYVKYTMLPWIARWEAALNWKLFNPQERERGFYVKFNVEGLLRGDYKSRQEGLAVQRQNGIISTNEWREHDERNPRPEPEADVLLVNGNMISVATAAKQQPRQAGAAPSQSGGEGNG